MIWICCLCIFRGTVCFALWIEDRSRRRCVLMFKRQLSNVIEGTAAPATVHKAAIGRTWSDPIVREWTGRHPTWSEVGWLVLTPTSAGAFIVKRFQTCDTNLTMTLSLFLFPKDPALTLQCFFFFNKKGKKKVPYLFTVFPAEHSRLVAWSVTDLFFFCLSAAAPH